mgnify:CR=1 FL=1
MDDKWQVAVSQGLTEEKHVHEIRVNLVQIPDAREKSLSEDTMKNIEIGRQLIGLLLCLRVVKRLRKKDNWGTQAPRTGVPSSAAAMETEEEIGAEAEDEDGR